MKNKITLSVNETASIQFVLPCTREELLPCDEIKIVFHYHGKSYPVYSNDSILWALRCFDDSLT